MQARLRGLWRAAFRARRLGSRCVWPPKSRGSIRFAALKARLSARFARARADLLEPRLARLISPLFAEFGLVFVLAQALNLSLLRSLRLGFLCFRRSFCAPRRSGFALCRSAARFQRRRICRLCPLKTHTSARCFSRRKVPPAAPRADLSPATSPGACGAW